MERQAIATDRERRDQIELIERLDEIVRSFLYDSDYKYMRVPVILAALREFAGNWTPEGIAESKKWNNATGR